MKTKIFRANQTVGRTACSQSGPARGPDQPPKNMIVASAETVTMLAYSASMNMANFSELYSVCHPATSSCSDSARSKRNVLVSPTALTRETKNDTGWRKIFQREMKPTHVPRSDLTSCCRQNVLAIITTPTKES